MQVPTPVTTFYLQDGTSVEFPLKTAINSEDVEDYKESLVRVYLAPNINYIDDATFQDCENLTQVTIMNKNIGVGTNHYIFDVCSSLISVTFNGTLEDLSNTYIFDYTYAKFQHENVSVICNDGIVQVSDLD